MIDAVNYRGLEMPPTGKLKDREISALAQWVKIGAPWPQEKPPSPTARASDFAITDQDRHYWAFQPVGHPKPPAVARSGWVANPIDAFILARLEKKGLRPNPPAEPRSLIRRLYFDLVGLPPKPEEVDAFVADPSPARYQRVVDDLLSRKEYGERWGRHWLDVTRFAQTNGYERDGEKLEAWRYRDYVIDSLNADKPFDRFVIEQLAGDELENPTRESIIATGFYRLGVWDDEPDNVKIAAWDEMDEMVRTTGAAFLGLTLGCARCHNHMFDPIPQEDYYRFAAFFRNVEPYGVSISTTHRKENAEGIFIPLGSPSEFAAWKKKQRQLNRQAAEVKSQIDQVLQAGAARLIAKGIRNPSRRESDKALTAAEKGKKTRLEKELANLTQRARTPPFTQALGVREARPPFLETRVLVRGNVETPGKRVEPRIPEVLGGATAGIIPVSYSAEKPQPDSLRPLLTEMGVKPTLGLRLRLARWIASSDNPLTPRVIMNRLWQDHFGRGIVRSSDNFGRAGTPPTHPELLAWLARDFVDGGWTLKRMHKQIVLSSTYRMASSSENPHAAAVDADNDLFWRQNLRRLDAEAIRDAMLAVAGKLNPEMGGRGIFPTLSPEVLATQSRPGFGWGKSSPEEERRRSVYIYLKRTLMVPFLETFDYTNTAESLGVRPVTTVAPQALLLLNSEFANQQAAALAARVRREAGGDRRQQVERLFRLALNRAPTPRESALAGQLLRTGFKTETRARPREGEAPAEPVFAALPKGAARQEPRPPSYETNSNQSGSGGARLSASPAARGNDSGLESLCLVVLNLNEFVYID